MNVENSKSILALNNKKDSILSALFYIVPFVLLSVYLIIAVTVYNMPDIAPYYILYYIYTYERGFMGKGLLGEVISWFSDTVDDEMIININVFFSFVLIFAASLCIGKMLNKVKNDKSIFYPVLLLIISICFFPDSFSDNFCEISIDKIFWGLTMFAVFLADRKYAIWLTIPLCMIATLVNAGFLFYSMVLIAIILLEEFHLNGHSLKNGLVCFFAYGSMIAIGLCELILGSSLNFKSSKELVEFYGARYSGTENISYELLEDFLVEYFADSERMIEISKIFFFENENGLKGLLSFIFVTAPIFLFLTFFWIKAIKRDKDKFHKFTYFLCAISPMVGLPGIVSAWESNFYFTSNILVQLCLILYFVAKKNETVTALFKETFAFLKKNILFTTMIVMYSALIILQ